MRGPASLCKPVRANAEAGSYQRVSKLMKQHAYQTAEQEDCIGAVGLSAAQDGDENEHDKENECEVQTHRYAADSKGFNGA